MGGFTPETYDGLEVLPASLTHLHLGKALTPFSFVRRLHFDQLQAFETHRWVLAASVIVCVKCQPTRRSYRYFLITPCERVPITMNPRLPRGG